MAKKITQDILNHLIPINRLNIENQRILFRTAKGSSVAKGQSLSGTHFPSEMVYLLEGQMRLEPLGMEIDPVVDGILDFHDPMFQTDAERTNAVADSNCVLIRFDRALFESLLEAQNPPPKKEEELVIHSEETGLFHEIFIACNDGGIELPPMPDVAARIRMMSQDNNTSTDNLTKVLQVDPAIAGRVVFAANSAFYRGRSPIASVKEAVVRMGFDAVSKLAMSMALKKAYDGKARSIRSRMTDLWHRAVHVSALSYIIARRCGDFDPEKALLAGLLHDIGAVPIVLFAAKCESEMDDDALDLAIERLREDVGLMVMGSWQLDEEIETVIRDGRDWSRDPAPEADYCDIVVVAQLYANRIGGRTNADDPSVVDIPAFSKLRLGADSEEDRLEILRDAEREIAEIRSLLQG